VKAGGWLQVALTSGAKAHIATLTLAPGIYMNKPLIPALGILCLASSSVAAGELIRDATVVEVANTAGGGAEFAVRLSGGVGVCVGASFVIFPEAKAASATSHKQEGAYPQLSG
jgi:hypothetical protein